MICPQCGNEASGHFCSECGARLSDTPPAEVASPSAKATAPQAPAAQAPVAPPPAPSPQPGPPPTPVAAKQEGPLCPVCCGAVLQVTQVKGTLGLGHHPAMLCPRCGATLVQHKDDPARFELTATRQATLPNWRTYAHQTLTVGEWQRIAHGGASDAKQQESDLAEAMSRAARGPHAPAAGSKLPDPAQGRRAGALRVRWRQPARAALGDPRRLRRPLDPRRQGTDHPHRRLSGTKPRGAQGDRRRHTRAHLEASLFLRPTAFPGGRAAQADLGRCLLRRGRHPPIAARRRPSSSSASTTTPTPSPCRVAATRSR